MKYLLLAALVSSAVQAVPTAATPGLLPTAVVRPILTSDPRVVSGRAGFAAAQEDWNILSSSPFEWTARATAQRRKLEQGPTSREWNVGVERTIRLPGKANADRRIGKFTIDEGEARYGKAKRQTALELLGLWLDWTNAEQTAELASTQLQIVQENLTSVEKRVKAGDASKLDASLARAELAEQRRLGLEAATSATVAWERLHARFPSLTRQYSVVPTPVALDSGVQFWRERILASSDELKIAQAQLTIAQATSERARADKIPDPTIGLYTASEAAGQERLTGVSISIPIPDSNRSNRANKAAHATEMSRQEVELRKRDVEAEIASQVANTNGTFKTWKAAEAGALEMDSNARLTQRAYSLGEADLQLLLTARRQAAGAAVTALTAKTSAARAYYTLLVNAHLVWDMSQE